MRFTDDGAEFVAEQGSVMPMPPIPTTIPSGIPMALTASASNSDHLPQLFFGSAHRRKQTELLCSFRYGIENAL